jgi:hypothetical protein
MVKVYASYNRNMERARPAGYLHTGLDRYEVFDFQEDGLGELKSFIKSKKLPFSFHVPFSDPHIFPIPE